MKLVWLNIAIMVAYVHGEPCQPCQERFGDSCYQLLAETMTWEEAAKTCSDMGGGLAVPDSLDEQQFIWKMFTGTVQDGNLWIGCTDLEGEGRYVQPGEGSYECSYFNWAPEEPKGNRQNCAQMWRNGHWDDTGCVGPKFVICERRVMPSMFCLQTDADGRFTSTCLTGLVVIKEFPTNGVIACGSACRDEPRCRSFNLRQQGSRGEKICQLNNITLNDADEKDTVLDTSCNYFNF